MKFLFFPRNEPIGPIVGGVVGGLVFLIGIALIIFSIRRRQSPRTQNATLDDSKENELVNLAWPNLESEHDIKFNNVLSPPFQYACSILTLHLT